MDLDAVAHALGLMQAANSGEMWEVEARGTGGRGASIVLSAQNLSSPKNVLKVK